MMTTAQVRGMREMAGTVQPAKPAGVCADCIWRRHCQRVERLTTGEGCAVFALVNKVKDK
jgi:hypothetical protein